jgi:hypothetical protein
MMEGIRLPGCLSLTEFSFAAFCHGFGSVCLTNVISIQYAKQAANIFL